MSRDSAVPTALIRQLQISLREDFSLPSSDLSSDPSSTPAPLTIPSIQDAVASLDPSMDASARCGRCRGGLLCGDVSRLCVCCGEGFKGGEGVLPEISFTATNAYKLLLESLGLDGSEAVNLDLESAESNKDRDASKAGMILSDLLDLKLAFSPIQIYVTDTKTETKNEPATYDLNLSGIDLDAVFKETKKETPQIGDTNVNLNQVPSRNQTTVVSSFAKWEPDFQSQSVNHSTPVQISAPASENFSKTNLKKEALEIEPQADDDFDEWQDFAGLRASQNTSDSVEKAGSSVESREPLKEVDSPVLDQSVLSHPEEVAKTSPQDELPIENREPLDAGEEDLFVDWKAFTSSGGGEQGSSEAGVKPELSLPEQVPVKNVEPLNHEDDLFDDWKNFTGPGIVESGLSVPEEKTAPMSGDLFTVSMVNEALHNETPQGDVDDSFDEWNDFAGSNLGQSRSTGLEENSKTFWDPSHATEIEKPSNMETSNVFNSETSDDRKNYAGSVVEHIGFLGPEEKTQPITQDQLTVEEIKRSDKTESLHVEFSDSFDDWNDFTDSGAVQARSTGDGKTAETISRDSLPVNTTDKPSSNILTSTSGGSDSFDDWKDFTLTSAQPFNNIGTSDANGNDSFDDWNDFTSSSAVQSGLPDAEERNEPAVGNSSEDFNVWPIGGAESKKDGGSIDLWSSCVNREITNSVPNNGNSDLSDGWLDFMSPSQGNGTVSVEGVKINNRERGSSDNWLDFTGLNEPTNTKSENLNPDKEDPDDLFNDWNAFSASSQSAKTTSNLIEKNSEVGEPKHGDLSDDWLDFSGSGELKANPELKTENNGTNDVERTTNSDDWSNFTGINAVKRPESKNLSDDWQDFTSTAPVLSNVQDMDFGDFIQSNSSAAPTDHKEFGSLNGVSSDPLSFFSTPSINILNPSSNSNVNSKTENASDIQKFLSQMSDLSFMLKDELSIPDKLHSK